MAKVLHDVKRAADTKRLAWQAVGHQNRKTLSALAARWRAIAQANGLSDKTAGKHARRSKPQQRGPITPRLLPPSWRQPRGDRAVRTLRAMSASAPVFRRKSIFGIGENKAGPDL